MSEILFKTRGGLERRVNLKEGISLMELIRDTGVDKLPALCGSSCSCVTRHVHVDPQFGSALPPMSEEEDDLPDSSEHRAETSRLSCQIRLTQQLAGLCDCIAPEE